MATARRGYVLTPGGGHAFRHGRNDIRVKAGSATGAVGLSVLESVFPPGAGADEHVHHHFEEAFYLLEGDVEYRVGRRVTRVTPGSFVFVPPGVAHGFVNRGSGAARHLAFGSSGRVSAMVEELGRLVARGARPDEYARVVAQYDLPSAEEPGSQGT